MSDRPIIPLGRWDLPTRARHLGLWRRLTGPQLLVGSFAILVLLGTLGFKWLPGLYTGPELTWRQALFTSTSAVCVTGLIVVDTATYFTFWGQAYILLLIQLGGLGIITFASLLIVALGRRLSLRQEAISREAADVAPAVKPILLLRDVVIFTFAIELAGALLLYVQWVSEFGWTGAIWPAVFHSVSAFCNAGFSTFTYSLVPYQRAPGIQLVVMLLIILGGIGFLTMEELRLRWQAGRKKRIFRLSLHSRLVLIITALLILGGWIIFAFLEWSISLKDLPPWARLLNALFMSVTARTAGFNTVDYAQMSDSGNFFTVLLMMIGGSPGSTAGGIKTTTFALIFLLAWSRFRRHEITSVAGRSVPEETIQRAIGLTVTAFGLVTGAILALPIAESPDGRAGGRFLAYMFEATSAFNTVGLSMGVTAAISAPGQLILVALMFLGRVGPLALAAALARREPTMAGEFRYAYEDVVVG